MNKEKINLNKQEGAALAIGLILLLIITLMGYAGMKGTMLQEKMAAGLHNRTLSNSGANSAIRQGESFLFDLVDVTNGISVYGTANGAYNNLYSLLSNPQDPTSPENTVLTNFFQQNFTSTDGTAHNEDFTALSGNGSLKSIPEYIIYEVVYGNSGGTQNTEEPIIRASLPKQRSFMVTGKSQSGDGNSISLMQSMFTVVTGSDATN